MHVDEEMGAVNANCVTGIRGAPCTTYVALTDLSLRRKYCVERGVSISEVVVYKHCGFQTYCLA